MASRGSGEILSGCRLDRTPWPRCDPVGSAQSFPETAPRPACLGIATLGRYPGPMSSLHKFKIGQVVLYRGDQFRVIRRLEVTNGQPTSRIRRESDGSERVSLERELTDPTLSRRRTKE